MKNKKYLLMLILISIITTYCTKFENTKLEENKINESKIEFAPRHYICYKTDMPLEIDGRINDAAWQKAAWTEYFVDIEGLDKPKPKYSTHAKMLWDKQYFYIIAEIEEPDVWATIKKRDEVIFYDNDFEVFIDPDGDTHQYYELEMNAFNTAWDLLLTKPYRDDNFCIDSWDIHGLRSAVYVDGTINNPNDKDVGWMIEIAIPWKVLEECTFKKAPPEKDDQWRVNFSRVEWKVEVKNGKYSKVINPKTGKHYPEDNWIWSPQGVINMHCPEMWGFVQFSDKIVGKGEDTFKTNYAEEVKWILRKIYYEQRKYYINNNCFTIDIQKLDIGEVKLNGYKWPPEIQTTESFYEVIIEKNDGTERWHISQDGKCWMK